MLLVVLKRVRAHGLFYVIEIVVFKLCRLIDQALAKGVKVAVCSTSNEKAVCTTRFYNISSLYL